MEIRQAFVVYPNTRTNEADEVLLCCISSSLRHVIKYRNHGNILTVLLGF